MHALLLSYAACAALVLSVGPRLKRGVWLVGAVAPAATVVWLIANSATLAGGTVTSRFDWVPSLGLTIDGRVDAFAALMIVLVAGIGLLIFAYGWRYFAFPRAAKAAGYLTLFAGSMFGVVIADNLLVLYVCWELTSVTSYLLIGLDDTDPEARAAAQQALLVTVFGGLAMLCGFIILGQQAGTYRLSELLDAPPSGALTSVALVLVLLGAFTKSAQYPFHSWLPRAMVAPTPISAYLHAAAMVKAGVYLVARLAPAFATVGLWRPVVVGVGLLTMIAGGLRALRPFDLKQLLAFGTISQLGFLVVLFGIGEPAATAAGCALILAHGLFKAALFLVVGVVDHETGTRDIRILPELGPGWAPTKIIAVTGAASMAAVPLFAGFLAKEQAYDALYRGSTGSRIVLAGIVIGSMLTVAYTLRFITGVLRPGKPPAQHAPGYGFVAPAAILTAATIALGVVPPLWSGLIDRAANALDPAAHAHLQLWHGITGPLLLSLLTLAGGFLLHRADAQVARIQQRWTVPLSAARVYDAVLHATVTLAARLTSVVQSGSLPIYIVVILSTAVLLPAAALLSGTWWTGWPDLIGSAAHLPIVALLVGGAVAATRATRRFAAAILLGVVGYAMALLFVVHGAPDLALTQFAVETLSVVLFLLVLRLLPDRFERRAAAVNRSARLVISAAVGLFMVVMAIAASGARTQPSVSAEMAERALPEGHGRNVVNVILVDIRGMDTLGEITVLLTAGLGIVALVHAGRKANEQ